MVDKHGVIVFDDNIHAGVSPEIKKQYFTRYILLIYCKTYSEPKRRHLMDQLLIQ